MTDDLKQIRPERVRQRQQNERDSPLVPEPPPVAVHVENVHRQELIVVRKEDPETEPREEAEVFAEKLLDHGTGVTRSGEYVIDEVGKLVFVPYPQPEPGEQRP
jgi:hypothetical protein